MSQIMYAAVCEDIERQGISVVRGTPELLGVPAPASSAGIWQGLPDPGRPGRLWPAAVIVVLLIVVVAGIAIYSRTHRSAVPAAQPGTPGTTAPAAQPGGAGSGANPAGTASQAGAGSSSAQSSSSRSNSSPTSTNTAPQSSAAAVTPPATPGNIAATADGQYQTTVAWTPGSADATGFNVDNGCPAGSCGGNDATLSTSVGSGTSTSFTVTPGTYQCFRVQAFNSAGSSGWSGYGCTSTPGLDVPAAQMWTDSGVGVSSGERLGLTAAGTAYIDPVYPVGPTGTTSCVPATTYPSSSSTFAAPNLARWSLIARIGNGPPFEVGSSAEVITTSGELYLGMNDNNFADNSGSWTVRIKIGGMPPPA